MQAKLSSAQLNAIAGLTLNDPHRVLGRHLVDGRLVYRAFLPHASAVSVRRDGQSTPMTQVHPDGIFELVSNERRCPPPGGYRLEVSEGAKQRRIIDPYAFAPTIGELDLHLIGEGRHRKLYQLLGAHVRENQEVQGTAFCVWAPSARRVSVVGDFNDWDGRCHVMRHLGPGVWELFLPGIGPGALYKFEICSESGALAVKADPVGRAMELRPSTASRVTKSKFRWTDSSWLEKRRTHDPARRPMSIYEVHLGSWRQHEAAEGEPPLEMSRKWLSYRELADELVDYVADMGFTHIELMPVMEHPLDASWGYQVGGYYAPTSRYGSPDDFRAFVDRCHARDIAVIIDWVPAHFPKDEFALGRFDGTALYEHLDARLGEHRQWGTYIFNYGRHEVRNFLVANALYWLEEFHVDGLRADAVASMIYLDYAASWHEWLPNRYGGRENLEAVSFVRELNDAVHDLFPGCVVIAEESTSWPGVTHATSAGGLGFDLKWNMGWMHDTLDYFKQDSVFRSFHHNLLTFGLMYAFSEHFVLPLSHDEVVHLKKALLSKMAGDRWQMLANLRALYGHMWAHPGKKLLFMGGELGQWEEWSETRPLDWPLLDNTDHAGVQRLVRDLNHLYRATPPLYQADHESVGFRWIDANDNQQSVVSYLRFGIDDPDDCLLCVGNFTPVPRVGYRIGVPTPRRHDEVLNTDAVCYGGSGMGNLGSVAIEHVPAHGFAQSLVLTLPPLSTIWLRPERIKLDLAQPAH